MIGRGITRALRRLRRDEDGATLVEFSIVLGVLLLIVFGLIDFGRLGFSYVMAQKATERAVRQAVVLAPVCTGVPDVNTRGTLQGGTDELEFGASCSIDPSLCSNPGTFSCTMATASPSADTIWSEISSLLPSNATRQNLLVTYSFDNNLGFLGGPYTPLVTVELVDLDFEFVTPVGAFAGMATSTGSQDVGTDFAFPSMSVSLPAESLGST